MTQALRRGCPGSRRQRVAPRGERGCDRGVVAHEPSEVAQRVLEHCVDADRSRCRHRLPARQLSSTDGKHRQRILRQLFWRLDHRHVGEGHAAFVVPPRRGVHDLRRQRVPLQGRDHLVAGIGFRPKADSQGLGVHRLQPEDRTVTHEDRQDLEGLGGELRGPRGRREGRPDRRHQCLEPAGAGPRSAAALARRRLRSWQGSSGRPSRSHAPRRR